MSAAIRNRQFAVMTSWTPVVVILLVGGVACGGDGTTEVEGPDVEEWVATLTTDAVVGTGVTASSSGSSTIRWNASTRMFSWTIDVAGITAVTEAHIHGPATPSQDAPVRLWLFAPDQPTGPMNGRMVSGNVHEDQVWLEGDVTLEQVLTWIRSSMAHVMVHTSEYPNGEIRGHIVEN
jgi:hypothetical protein